MPVPRLTVTQGVAQVAADMLQQAIYCSLELFSSEQLTTLPCT